MQLTISNNKPLNNQFCLSAHRIITHEAGQFKIQPSTMWTVTSWDVWPKSQEIQIGDGAKQEHDNNRAILQR
jgi:hypothetical protein